MEVEALRDNHEKRLRLRWQQWENLVQRIGTETNDVRRDLLQPTFDEFHCSIETEIYTLSNWKREDIELRDHSMEQKFNTLKFLLLRNGMVYVGI